MTEPQFIAVRVRVALAHCEIAIESVGSVYGERGTVFVTTLDDNGSKLTGFEVNVLNVEAFDLRETRRRVVEDPDKSLVSAIEVAVVLQVAIIMRTSSSVLYVRSCSGT